MEKIPPQNEQAEQAVLGGILIDSEAIWRVIDILKPDDFYSPKHEKIYSAILDLVQLKQPIDILTLSDRLKALGILEEVGGLDYLTYLINTVPSAFNIYNYAKIVVDKKIRRDLVSISNEIFNFAFDESLATEELLDVVEQRIFSVVEKSSPYEFKHIKNLLEAAYERIEALQKQEGVKKYRGIPTGFEELDNYLSGLQKSDFIILASRPSLGKTTLALDIARNAAVNFNIPVGIFSLEMSSDQIVDRFLAAEAGISLWRLRTGKLYTEGEINEMALLANAFDKLSQAPIYIDDTPTLNILQIRAMARRLDAEVGLGLLIIDYLQLIHSYKSYESRVQEITDISRSLKALARELQIPVLAISQLSRAPEQRASQVPRLSDLRESGCLTGDTLILDAESGRYIPIKEIAEKKLKIKVLTINNEGKIEIKKLVKAFYSGKKMTYLLKTKTGREIKASSNHPFYTPYGWKALEELRMGENIAAVPPTKFETKISWQNYGGLKTFNILNSAGVKNLLRNNLFWDEVVEIMPLKVEEVYDATIEENHNFLANDIFVHNSLEQDADVVLFIHRPDKGEMNNQAQIIIAKHRNGPRGIVNLYFDSECVSFKSLHTQEDLEVY
jgi:replicative DNA helicase